MSKTLVKPVEPRQEDFPDIYPNPEYRKAMDKYYGQLGRYNNKLAEANDKAHILSIGTVNPVTGGTQYDWSIYDNKDTAVYLTGGSQLLYCAPGTFEIGDKINLVHSDNGRIAERNVTILDWSLTEKDLVMEMLKANGYDYTPLRPFQKRTTGKGRLRTCYSVKGVEAGIK